MPIVGGLDIHRKQITFDYLDTATGEVRRGQIAPADRAHLRAWLARFAGRDDAAFALEGCTGWRYVAEELAAAGVTAHVAEPADTAFARGRKRHAKTDKTDARHLRVLLEQGRLPECWIPPAQILECRALLEAYHDLRREHTAWIERIHAVFFHQGAPRLGEGALRTDRGLAALRQAAACHLSPAGQLQVATALDMLAAVEARMDTLRQQLLHAARHLAGARALQARLYGVGPLAGLAMTCWPGGAGRFSSSRKAVRFAGLDVTVYSSDGRRSPGHLSRQGPEILRWVAYEAGKTHGRAPAPRPRLLRPGQGPPGRQDRSPIPGPQAHPPGLPHPGRARRRRAHRRLSPDPFQPVTVPRDARPGRQAAAAVIRWGTTAASSRSGCQLLPPCRAGHADGLKRLGGRILAGGDTRSIIMSPGAASARGPR